MKKQIKKTPRGIRNNNPGNIRYNGIAWQGLANPPSDGEFCIFREAHFGIRALAKLLRNYNKYYGLRTISGIIRRYAPDTENNTDAYIASVSRSMAVDAHFQMDLDNTDTMLELVKAIIKHENGRCEYKDDEITKAITC
ncbi:MAG: hypothetical protein LBL75_01665 [Rickettsiales bacterium]|jgi:hypothetical protein|nr:hypothetical protein [Rickettsiales bacterium]